MIIFAVDKELFGNLRNNGSAGKKHFSYPLPIIV